MQSHRNLVKNRVRIHVNFVKRKMFGNFSLNLISVLIFQRIAPFKKLNMNKINIYADILKIFAGIYEGVLKSSWPNSHPKM